jgi:hypothetical protein
MRPLRPIDLGTAICRDLRRWAWAAAEPAVPRGGFLQ